MTSIPTHGAYGTTAANFNDDGRCDLLICNSYQSGSYIYWGHQDGFSTAHRQTVEVGSVLASGAADLNRDGHLDLVFAGNRGGKNVGTILWGSSDGFIDAHNTVLELKTQRCGNINIADLNRDGFLDLVYNDDYFGTMQIFWGNAQAQYTSAQAWFDKTSGGSLGLADLNGDGNLDFVISGGFDAKKLSPNTKTRVFWGTPSGTPSKENVIELESFQACEVAIADLNRDGHLDLVLGNYMSETTRSLPLFVYWGAADSTFSEKRRLELPAESSCGIEVLDLNRDSHPELIVHNHLKDTAMTDPGNIYTRKLEEHYTSAPIEIPSGKIAHRLAWKATEPHGSKLHFQIRTAESSAALARQMWQDAAGGEIRQAAREKAWLQYRAVFSSPDAGNWPVLHEVGIELK